MILRQEQRRHIAARVRTQITAPRLVVKATTLAGSASKPEALPGSRSGVDWARVRKQVLSHPIHAAAAVILVLLFGLALVGPLLPLPDHQQQDLLVRLQPPMSRGSDGTLHIAGTDQLGRDVLSRLVAGARVTLGVALVTVILAGLVGAIFGLLAGFRGGVVDHAIMRLVDLQMAFPSLLFAVFLLYLLGANLVNLVLLLVIFGWYSVARIARAQTLGLRNQTFVESARAIGCTETRIVVRHIFPHLIPVLTVIAVFDFSSVMLAEAGLSFLGLGVQPPDTSWGRMISEGQSYIYSGGWWLFLFPGAAIFLAVLSTRLVSSWIQNIIGRAT